MFGLAWSDDVSVRLGHNGCDTRNDILAEQLTGVTFRAGTHDCVVIAGTFVDPYTGEVVHFSKSDAAAVQIDHVFPLAVAWDRGAHLWTPEQRRDFANDPDNLVVTTQSSNLEKLAKTPAAWLPNYESGRCLYVVKYAAVAGKYRLPLTVAEARVINDIASSCPR